MLELRQQQQGVLLQEQQGTMVCTSVCCASPALNAFQWRLVCLTGFAASMPISHDKMLSCSADMLRVPRGTIRATVLIETITAAFEMEEIIYELRQHSSGLNCGRWDYIFSFIKKFRNHPDKVLPNRCELGGEVG
jgi:hypothetical protein